MARSEAALGRFVISGDRDTGVFYYREWQRAGRLLARLKQLTAASPAQAECVTVPTTAAAKAPMPPGPGVPVVGVACGPVWP